MKLHKYKNYDEYVVVQTNANKRKLKRVWAQKLDIKFLSKYILSIIPDPCFGLCHGTRKGEEQKWFKKFLKCDVWGTEISSTAKKFAKTLQWDFHEIKPEWVGSCDFIYTNSWDHAYDPRKAFKAWCECLARKGILILEHTHWHEKSIDKVDPFCATPEEISKYIKKWTKGVFVVKEILNLPTDAGNKKEVLRRKAIIIYRKGM